MQLTVDSLLRRATDGFVSEAYYTCTDVIGGKRVEHKGVVSLESEEDTFTPYENLTEAMVVGWVMNALWHQVSGPDVTFVSWQTPQVLMNSTSQEVTVQFVINAADIAALVPPNSQPQSWTLNLVVNGV